MLLRCHSIYIDVHIYFSVKMWSLGLHRFLCTSASFYSFKRRLLNDKWIITTTSHNYHHCYVYISTNILLRPSSQSFKYLIPNITLCLWCRQSLYYCLGYHGTWGTCWGQKVAVRPFRWEHICMVIDVILLSPSFPLFAMPLHSP